MGNHERLSMGEFLKDIRLVVTSPGRRFGVIKERGAVWGSLVLLILPLYISFDFAGGIYFRREPFPGYSLILPLIAAVAAVFLKLYLIHISARIFQGRRPAQESRGLFTDLLAVFGYTGVPALLAILLATVIFLMVPDAIGNFMRNFRVAAVSVMVALGIALFVWNLILVVLALRFVYKMRDFKIVCSFILGSALMAVPAFASAWIVRQVKVDLVYLQPIIASRILRFFTADPASSPTSDTRISVHIDRLAYRLRSPERFELVAFQRKNPTPREKEPQPAVAVGARSVFSWEEGNRIIGRIVGLPGDKVALVKGKLYINGQAWDERYIAPEYRTDDSIAPISLGSSQYLVLPENRHLLGELTNEIVVSRDQIGGREAISQWPLGWLLFRPTVFLQAQPAAEGATR